MNNYNTAYDDVFRTLIVDCRTLIIPVVNEIFHTSYVGNEKIFSSENEIFLKQQDGDLEKIITDSTFEIISEGGETRHYHLECQSSNDGSMLVRMYEYDSQLALKNGAVIQHTLTVSFPESAVLYLRHGNTTPDIFEVTIRTPGGCISYGIPVLKVQQYDIGTIFEKGLLFFIPFYIFAYEKQFKELEHNRTKLEALKNEYIFIASRLEGLVQEGAISEYTKKTICEMSERVIRKIAEKYESIRKEVVSIMGGKVLEYEAKDILREGALQTLYGLVRDGLLAIEEAAKRADMTVEEFRKDLNK